MNNDLVVFHKIFHFPMLLYGHHSVHVHIAHEQFHLFIRGEPSNKGFELR